MFCSEHAVFDGKRAIRGGIPICWPQFGKFGSCENQHGLARNSFWTFSECVEDVEEQMIKAKFVLRENEESLRDFPYKFELVYEVTLKENELISELICTNMESEKEFEFTTALHTYFGVKSITDAVVKGLNGVRYTDSLTNDTDASGKKKILFDGEEEIVFDREVDRIYRRNVSLAHEKNLEIIDRIWEEPGVLAQQTRGIAMKIDNLIDAVVWNPWIDKSKAMGDFGDEEYKNMLCVEAAKIDEPVRLKPKQTWSGSQTLTAVINLAHLSV